MVSLSAISSPPPFDFLFRVIILSYPSILMVFFPTSCVSTSMISPGFSSLATDWRLWSLLLMPRGLLYNIFNFLLAFAFFFLFLLLGFFSHKWWFESELFRILFSLASFSGLVFLSLACFCLQFPLFGQNPLSKSLHL